MIERQLLAAEFGSVKQDTILLKWKVRTFSLMRGILAALTTEYIHDRPPLDGALLCVFSAVPSSHCGNV